MKPVYRPQLLRKSYRLASLALLTPLALTACQISPSISQNSLSTTLAQLPAEQQSQIAKDTLLKSLQKQYRSSYAYHVDVLGSNDLRRENLAKASSKQLAMSDNPEEHCEHIHDEAYVTLLEQAEKSGRSITDAIYSAERESIKSSFLECQTAYEEWNNEAPYDKWLEQAIDQAKVDLGQADEANTEGSTVKDSTEENQDTEYYEDAERTEFLPGYDASHTKLDVRKAKLLDAYLLNPMSLTSTGVYRPLSGKLSIVPTFSYQRRNLTLSNSHFIYVDAKEGSVYLWADTFAYLMSAYLDENLGLGMQDKWIKIDLNDGSLPNGFLMDLIKSHLQAQDKMYANSANSQYRFLSTAQLQNQSPKPDAKHLSYMNNASTVIERTMTEAQFKEGQQLYLSTLYNQITNKYPQLVVESNLERDDDGNIEDSVEESIKDDDDSNKDTFNSRVIFTKIFKAIDDRLKNSSLEETDTITTSDTSSVKVNIIKVNPAIDYAVRDDSQTDNKWLWRNVYGLDNRQHIVWQLAQRQMKETDSVYSGSDDLFRGLRLEALIRYSDISVAQPMFNTLPAGASLPSKSNSVDLKAYLTDLKQRYEKGQGTEQGKILFETFRP